VKESNLDDVLVEVVRLVPFDRILNMVKTVRQVLEKCHGVLRVPPPAAPSRPICCLRILYHVDSIGPQQRKEYLEGLDDVLIQVAAIINNDVEPSLFARQAMQRFGIGLIALSDIDSMLTELSLLVEIDSDYPAVAEVCLPHAKRFSTLVRVFVAPDANFK